MLKTLDVKEVIHAQNDELWNVVALLDSVVKALDGGVSLDSSYTSRLISIAHDKVRAVQCEFQPFI